MTTARQARGRGPGICKEVLLGRVPDALLRAWLRPHRAALEAAGISADWRDFPANVSRRTLARTLDGLLHAEPETPAAETARRAVFLVDVLCRTTSRGALLVALLGHTAADQGLGRAEIAIRLWMIAPDAAQELADRLP